MCNYTITMYKYAMIFLQEKGEKPTPLGVGWIAHT